MFIDPLALAMCLLLHAMGALVIGAIGMIVIRDACCRRAAAPATRA